jgi:hypothetical protein
MYKKYDENEDYLPTLKRCKFGIWIGCHETQGFAFQEALSCNVPLFVYDSVSMKEECRIDLPLPRFTYSHVHQNLPATSASYFDEQMCGIVCKTQSDLDSKMNIFLQKLKNNEYNPRQFIVDNLSVACFEQRIEQFLQLQ